MAALFDEDLYEDLGYEEAEGMSDLYDEDLEMDEMDYFDEEEFDESFDEDEDEEGFEADDYFDDGFEDIDEYEGFDEYDEFDEDEEEDALDGAMAYALDSDDFDEFLGKLWKGIKKVGRKVWSVAKKAAPVIGKIGRIAAPILSKIPLPQAQIAARLARLAGRLRAEGASEDEILEAFAEVAATDRRALPLVAGLTAKTIVRGKGRSMSFGARKKLIKDMKKAAKVLVHKQGPKAIRALPKIAKSVKRTTAMKRTPTRAKAMIVKRTAMKVARSPIMTRKLAKPSPKAKHIARKMVKARSYTIPGPARISIKAL